jgi:hypothetical protein
MTLVKVGNRLVESEYVSSTERCMAKYPERVGWYCSLEKGHEGNHKAFEVHKISGSPKYSWGR